MYTRQFEVLVQKIAAGLASRRTALHAMVGAALGSLAPRSLTVEAKRRRKKRKKKKKVTLNDFGCVDVGKFCQTADQCCSGICQGKKGKRKCQAHDTGDCLADQDFCGNDEDVNCIAGGVEGLCFRTTGNASFCGNEAECFRCAKDADCQAEFGVVAACAICADCEDEGGTACVQLLTPE